MGNSKTLIRDSLRRRVARAPIIPLIYSLPARINELPVEDMFSNSTTLSNAIQAVQKLYNWDAILPPCDETLEAEALGARISFTANDKPEVIAPLVNDKIPEVTTIPSKLSSSPRLKNVLEAMKTISKLKGKDVGIMGIITGPQTLRKIAFEANPCQVERISEVITELSRCMLAQYCESVRVDGILLRESRFNLKEMESCNQSWASVIYETIINLCRFYDTPLVLVVDRCQGSFESLAEMACKLEFNILALEDEVPEGNVSLYPIPIGLPLKLNNPLLNTSILKQLNEQGSNMILASGDPSPEQPLDQIYRVFKEYYSE